MNKPIKVEKETGQRDEQGRPITVLDQELTAAAMQKADRNKTGFHGLDMDGRRKKSQPVQALQRPLQHERASQV